MTNEETIRELQWMRDNGYDADDSIIGTDRCKEAFDMAIEALENAPKKGEWIKRVLPDSAFPIFYCTECASLEFHKSKFCPNCGTYMRGE